MRFIFTFVAGALLASAPAFAADDSGFYAGAGIGSMSLSSENIPDTGGRDFDGSDFAWKIFGGWQLNQYFAFEVEYFDGGNPEDKFDVQGIDDAQIGIDISVTGWVPSVVVMWPFAEHFNVFGKLGVAMWSADLTGTAKYQGEVIDRIKADESGTDFAWGVGATWNITDSMGLRAEYQALEISDFNSADLVSASFIYKF